MDPLLYKAAVQGDLRSVPNNGDPSYLLAQTPQKNTALHISARFGHASFAEFIISVCPSQLDLLNEKGDTPLHVAARGGFLDLVQLLTREQLERAVDVEQGPSPSPLRRVNHAGNTALHEALKNRHGRVARHLLSADAGLSSVVNNNGESPLYLAVEVGFPGILRTILRHGPGLFSLQGAEGKTPLHAASIRRHARTLKLLLREVPELIMHKDNLGRTALHYAVTHSAAITRILLSRDHKLAYEIDNDGLSPLLIAIRYWNRQNVATILHYCPDCIELRDAAGRNALHIAAAERYMLGFLLKRPESKGLMNETDYDGNTPLHVATKCQYYMNAIRLIGARGIDLNARNNDGQTARDICETTPGVSYRKRFIWEALYRGKAVRGREHLKGMLSENVKLPITHPNVDLKPSANTLSVVAALLATVSCTAAFTVPGGYRNDGPQEGLAVLARKAAFKVFLVADAITVCASLTASYALNWALRGDDVLLRNVFGWCIILVYVSLVGVGVSFATGTFAVVSRVDLSLAITVPGEAWVSPVGLTSAIPFLAFCRGVAGGELVAQPLCPRPAVVSSASSCSGSGELPPLCQELPWACSSLPSLRRGSSASTLGSSVRLPASLMRLLC